MGERERERELKEKKVNSCLTQYYDYCLPNFNCLQSKTNLCKFSTFVLNLEGYNVLITYPKIQVPFINSTCQITKMFHY